MTVTSNGMTFLQGFLRENPIPMDYLIVAENTIAERAPRLGKRRSC